MEIALAPSAQEPADLFTPRCAGLADDPSLAAEKAQDNFYVK
jgi:hypothetical protein